MEISKKGIELIKHFEGCRLTAYKDSTGIPTIGYGHTRNVVLGMKITEAKAEELLKEDLKAAEVKVSKLDPIYHWTQNEYDALVSFCFNVGNVSAVTNFSKRTKKQISEKMLLYVNAGGKKLNGLVTRRKAEVELFCTPDLKATFEIGKTYVVKVSGLNIRKAPTIKAEKVQSKGLRKGSKVTIEEIIRDTEGNTWIKFTKGYIAAIYQGKYYLEEV